MKQPQGLLTVLRDPAATEDERDDAAMDLDAFDEAEVEEALILAASDTLESRMVAASAGESVARIWARKGRIPTGVMARLRSDARIEAQSILGALAPALSEEFSDDHDTS